MKLKNKYALVTGASTGIGKAIAIELANEGALVALTARRKDKLQETKEIIEKAGGKCDVIPADLANVNSINGLIETVQTATEQVDILVNVAGIWHGKDEVFAGKDLEDFTQKTIFDTYMVGFTSPTLLVHGLLDLLAAGGAKIVNISGTFEDGAKGWLPYYASKRGLEDLTVGLAEELKRLAIDVNCVSPSDVATEEYKKYFPEDAQDALKPDDVAKEVIKLCSDLSNGVTGKVIVLKKGQDNKEEFHS